jgi:ABC-2 type transport system ATP-binding protein
MTAGSPVVVVDGLTKRFGDLVAVDDLSFTVARGEIFGLLGPNGAGKSTTLTIVSTLMDHDAGQVTVDGHDLVHGARAIKAMIGLVPQDIAVFDTLTARENVSFFAGLYGLRGQHLKDKVAEALEFVGLADQAKKRAGRMSGGMRRRLNIACGIAHDPTLIILDEPTVGVDAQSREHIMGSIRTLRDRGATIIYTSHYMPEVQEICDRIAIVDHGRLVACGDEDELLALVTDVKTVLVTADLPDGDDLTALTGRLTALPGVRGAHTEDGTRLRIDVSVALDDITPLLGVLTGAGLKIQALVTQAADLETTFLALTGRELRQG